MLVETVLLPCKVSLAPFCWLRFLHDFFPFASCLSATPRSNVFHLCFLCFLCVLGKLWSRYRSGVCQVALFASIAAEPNSWIETRHYLDRTRGSLGPADDTYCRHSIN